MLATGQQPAGVHAYAGVAIFSRWDGAAYSLVVSENGGPPRVLGVPPQARPFDADIGPDPNGQPKVILRTARRLSLLGLDGTAPVPIAKIEVPNRDVHPTLWRGTVVWNEGRRIRTASRSRAITRLPARTDVLALELNGRRLALNVVRDAARVGVCGQREVRLLDVRTARVRVLGSQACGLNGQVFHGPTFDAGWLYFARSCNLDCGSTRYGAYRYRLRDGRYEIAGDGRPVAGWAWGGAGTAYQLRAVSDVGCSDPPDCTLTWVDGLRFKRVGAPIHG